MIKETLLASAFGLLGLVTVACGSQKKDLMAGTDYVNPFIGASTNTEAAGAYHGLGKTFPGATTPFGMVQVSPIRLRGATMVPDIATSMRRSRDSPLRR